jgi:glycerol-3-phosphate dehydrogenase subunit B
LTAAATACDQGAHVMLVSKGPGNFVLGAACVDLEGLDVRTFGLGECDTNKIEKAIGFFVKLTAAAGCAYEGGLRERRRVPTMMGTFADVSLAPRSLWKGDPRGICQQLVVGFEDLFAFDPAFVAERLSVNSKDIGLPTSYLGMCAKLPQIQNQPWLTPLEIASEIDRNPFYRQALIAALQPLVHDAELLIIPGVLGLDSDDDDICRFEDDIGCAICELPTLPPSVPGLRLLRRLESHLTTRGTETCTGFSVQKLCMDGDRCTGAVLDIPGRPRTVRADVVILASGKFSHLLEDLEPKETPGTTMRVNQDLQPLNSEGGVLAKNMYACGSVLGESESRHGNAIAIVSGYQAGMLACQRGVHYAKP